MQNLENRRETHRCSGLARCQPRNHPAFQKERTQSLKTPESAMSYYLTALIPNAAE